VNDIQPEEEEEYQTPDEMASDPPTPLPVSQVPAPMEEEVASYDTYQKHVKRIVQWLTAKENSQGQNPHYQQNALTSFLLMVCISSFLEVAKDAAKQTYQKWRGNMPFWWEHDKYKKIEALELKKFCKHGRQGVVWRYLTSIGVTNFEPNEPGDIDGWKNWLSRQHLIQVMEFCFATFWKDKVVTKDDSRWVLHGHIEAYWGWFDHLWAVQPELQNLDPTKPYPSGGRECSRNLSSQAWQL